MQEAHNKWRQTQEAGHAVVLRSYFSSPLLPSQVKAASTSPPEQRRQLRDGIGKAPGRKPTLHFHPPDLKQQPFLKYIHVVVLPLCQKALTLNKYTHPWRPYFQSCTSRSSKRGVINTSSEALFKDNHCFFERSTTPTPSFLSFSLLLFSRFHLYVPWCPLSARFQVKLCGIKVKVPFPPWLWLDC